MPLWLRNFTFNKILEAKQKESGANKKASQGKSTDIDLNSSIKAKIPKEALQPKPSSPNYTMKASKK
tara:strand:- start:25 stop:225 length:201 start_codon:yes stop_codon:yes gene_type:complete